MIISGKKFKEIIALAQKQISLEQAGYKTELRVICVSEPTTPIQRLKQTSNKIKFGVPLQQRPDFGEIQIRSSSDIKKIVESERKNFPYDTLIQRSQRLGISCEQLSLWLIHIKNDAKSPLPLATLPLK